MSSLLWFAAGAIAGAAATLFAVRSPALLNRAPRRYLLAAAVIALFAVAASALYVIIGARGVPRADLHAAGATAPASASAQSMDAAVAALEARLARQEGSDADWNLLAQAYEFQGRGEDAARARAHQLNSVAAPLSPSTLVAAADAVSGSSAPSGAEPAATDASLADAQRRAREQPRDPAAWLALADVARAQHDEPVARGAFQQLVALHAMSAQSWADYADVLASVNGGSFAGPAGEAIDHALQMDSANLKAVWLKASQEHAARHYAAALVWWRKLRALLPADSSDARIIDENIAEDAQLAGGVGATAPAATSVPTQISGTVAIDGALLPRVPPGATLFIYAKAADSPGPPLAVLRAPASGWPVRFRLDDSAAMIPSRRLSQFQRVIVEARVSGSGQATPSRGDLFATSVVLNPQQDTPLVLVVNREIQ